MGRLEEEALRQLELPRDACHLVRLQRNRRRGSSRPCSIAQRVFCGSSGPSNRLRQVVLAREVGAVFHVGDDDQRAHGGQQVFMPVALQTLVLDKVVRLEHFADIVKVRPDAQQ